MHTFNGVEKKNPESFRRNQKCLSANLDDLIHDSSSLLSLLDIDMK